MLGATLLVLLIASINYQLNLGYLLTFLLAGSVAVGMHVCHATLRGLAMHLMPPDAAVRRRGRRVPRGAEQRAAQRALRHRPGGARAAGQWPGATCRPRAARRSRWPSSRERRGLHPVPPLTAETRFPLGTFRVWTVWRPAAQVLVYPAPEAASAAAAARRAARRRGRAACTRQRPANTTACAPTGAAIR